MQPIISVIMLTYNRESYVGRMIESVLGQTYTDFEFIIVDNGSTDRSGAIADNYATKDTRIRVIHCERGNIGSGRNTGLDAAKGEWIAFVDDDDWCEPDYLEFLLNLAVENGADVSICGASGREYDEKHIMTAEDAMFKLLLRKYFNVQFPTKLIHRSLFNGIRFSATAKYDDIELFPCIVTDAHTVAYYGLAKYTFDRGHGGNNSAWTTDHSLINADILTEYLNVYHNRTALLCKKFPNNSKAWQYFEWSFMISMVEKITRFEISGCKKQLDMMLSELMNNKEEFLSNKLLLDFEKSWIEKFVNEVML